VALACIASVPGILVALAADLVVSVRAAAWIGASVVLSLNVYMLWRGRSPRLNWVLAGCADRVYVRMLVRRVRGWAVVQEPDVIVLEASEIASVSARSVEVFLHGPKPRVMEWLVIEPAQTITESFSNHTCSSLCSTGQPKTVKQALVANEEGCLTINWEWVSPCSADFSPAGSRGDVHPFVIAPEERSDVDLNGILEWGPICLGKPDAQQRHLLARALSLGFGYDCTRLLSRYRGLSFREAGAYLAEVEREEEGTRH